MLKVVESGAGREAGEQLFELDEIARIGARRMLMAALKTEADDYVERHREERDETGRALVVHNGRSQGRKLTLGTGTVELRVPRVNDRRRDEHASASALVAASCRPTCGVRPRWPRYCPFSICADSPPAISAPRSKGCWARTRLGCRRPTSHGLPPAGRKNTRRFAGATSRAASTFTCGSMGCISTSGSQTTGWCHKLANVLDKLPQRLQPRAKRALHEM